jgi:hypothetical protein
VSVLVEDVGASRIEGPMGESASISGSPQLEVHPIVGSDPQTALQVVQTLLAGQDVRLSLDPKTNSLVAMARPAQQATIKATLEQLQSQGQRFEVIRLVREIERSIDLAWVRGIAHGGDVLGCRRVADSVCAAVCVGGDLSCERDFLPWLHQRAGNLIELDIHRLGITGALRVAEAAFGFELPVMLTAAPGNIHVQLAAVMPNFMSAEVIDPPPAGAGFSSDISFRDGRGVAGDRAGTGLSLEHGLLARGAGAKGQRP